MMPKETLNMQQVLSQSFCAGMTLRLAGAVPCFLTTVVTDKAIQKAGTGM